MTFYVTNDSGRNDKNQNDHGDDDPHSTSVKIGKKTREIEAGGDI